MHREHRSKEGSLHGFVSYDYAASLECVKIEELVVYMQMCYVAFVLLSPTRSVGTTQNHEMPTMQGISWTVLPIDPMLILNLGAHFAKDNPGICEVCQFLNRFSQ